MTSAEHTEPVAERVDRHSTRDRSAQSWGDGITEHPARTPITGHRIVLGLNAGGVARSAAVDGLGPIPAATAITAPRTANAVPPPDLDGHQRDALYLRIGRCHCPVLNRLLDDLPAIRG
ncbi:hypothetical protein [Actinomadura nitritigenes]|uniref:hypothetical protein n=1 Tax=Actinomadura nitritigenes TaxID=134602 RepID=UPI003D8C3986